MAIGHAVPDPEGKKEWPTTTKEGSKDNMRATRQSQRLATMLILSLTDTIGVQQSTVTDRLRHSKD